MFCFFFVKFVFVFVCLFCFVLFCFCSRMCKHTPISECPLPREVLTVTILHIHLYVYKISPKNVYLLLLLFHLVILNYLWTSNKTLAYHFCWVCRCHGCLSYTVAVVATQVWSGWIVKLPPKRTHFQEKGTHVFYSRIDVFVGFF